MPGIDFWHLVQRNRADYVYPSLRKFLCERLTQLGLLRTAPAEAQRALPTPPPVLLPNKRQVQDPLLPLLQPADYQHPDFG